MYFEESNLFKVYSCLLVWNKTFAILMIYILFTLKDLSEVYALYEKGEMRSLTKTKIQHQYNLFLIF